jgi:hypothetical protein
MLDELKGLVKERPWVLAIPVGAAVYFWWVRRPPAEEAEPGEEDTEGLDGGAFTGREPGPDGAADPGTPAPVTPGRPTTNAEWESAAIDYLVARGFSAAFAQTAVVKALTGEPLSTAEIAAVSLALAALGNPPEGMPPIGAAPPPPPPVTPPPPTKPKPPPVTKPAPKPAPKPPAPAYIAVKVAKWKSPNPPWNSTISGIAAHYGYGGNWRAVWNDARNAALRAKRGAPERIRPGDTVYVKKRG